MKYYKDHSKTEEGTTDVNGAWKPLKPLSEGFEFTGDDHYDNFLTKSEKKAVRKEGRKEIRETRKERRQDRREVRKDARASGSSRREARKIARTKIPRGKPVMRGAYRSLVRINWRGFAYKLDAIIDGSNENLKNELKNKWKKFGEWNYLVDAVNIGKTRKPFICFAKCRAKILNIQDIQFSSAGGADDAVEAVGIGVWLALAGTIISALSPILKQAQIGKQQREAIEASDRAGQEDFDNLPPEKQQEIIDAENQFKKDVEATNNQKYIWIGVGVVALLGLFFLVKKSKK